jgi:uncharacterized protein (DUF1810 family)
MDDPHNLRRFLDAQAGVIDAVRAELRAGQKRSHWMWFIFPQVAGLGHSDMARRYAISSLAEAQAYLAHPVLGVRLRNCVQLVNQTEAHSIEEIFGSPDDLKFRSSMTLFAVVDADGGVFDATLKKYFGGKPDDQTLAWAR